MGGIGVTVTLTEERETETLKRLKLSKMKSSDLMIGTLIPYAILGFVQVQILFAVALAFGYHYNPAGSLAFAGLIGMLGAIATVALGLLMAAFCTNSKQACNIGTLVAVPITFFTGAFFQIPNPALIPDLYGPGRPFGLFDFLPWRQCATALTKVLTFGARPQDVGPELALMTVETVILFCMGVFLYRRKQLKAE